MNSRTLFIVFSFFALMFININVIAAEDEALLNEERMYEDKDIILRFVQFSPQQIGSFYEGREFKKAAIARLMTSCYVTVIIKNTTEDILWLDLDEWEFSQNDKIFNRQTRAYWQKQWDDIGLQQAHRSTFSWTLMPAVRNLYPNEGVGGRIPIPMQLKPFSVTLNFPTGENKQGKVKSVKMHNMVCKQDKPKNSANEHNTEQN